MKIYLSKINEDWIIDRVKKEWSDNNRSITTKYIFNSDIIWIISPWQTDEAASATILQTLGSSNVAAN